MNFGRYREMVMKLRARTALRGNVPLRVIPHTLGLIMVALMLLMSAGASASDWQLLDDRDAKLVFAHPDSDQFEATISFYRVGDRGGRIYVEIRSFVDTNSESSVVLTYQKSTKQEVYLQYMSMEEVVQSWFLPMIQKGENISVHDQGKTPGPLGKYRYILFSAGTKNCAGINHRWGGTMSAVLPAAAHGKDQTDEINAFYCSPEPMTALQAHTHILTNPHTHIPAHIAHTHTHTHIYTNTHMCVYVYE